MASKWTVRADVTQLHLEVSLSGVVETFWIEVKKRLTVGEERQTMTAGFRSMRTGKPVAGGAKDDDERGATEIQVDWQAQGFARAETYLTDWSLLDDKSVKLKISRGVLESLDPAVFKAIEDGLTAHVEAMELEKKALVGKSSPSTT